MTLGITASVAIILAAAIVILVAVLFVVAALTRPKPLAAPEPGPPLTRMPPARQQSIQQKPAPAPEQAPGAFPTEPVPARDGLMTRAEAGNVLGVSERLIRRHGPARYRLDEVRPDKGRRVMVTSASVHRALALGLARKDTA